jgi:hypothetical protein
MDGMKPRLLIALSSAAAAIIFDTASQTNLPPVVTTNWVTATPSFREVNGRLFNTQRSILWKDIQGKIIKMLPGKLVVATFTTEPIYQAVAADEFVPGVPGGSGHHILSPRNVVVGEKTIPGPSIVIANYPAALSPADGQTISCRALEVGTFDYGDSTLGLWDYGKPHVVMVLTTNIPPELKAEAKQAAIARAVAHDQALADKGDPAGLDLMGDRYRDGDGVPKDLNKAREYFTKAAEAGMPGAAAELSNLNQ